MKRVLVDNKGEIVYEGSNAKEILRILNAAPDEVTEEDEVLYEKDFRPLIGKGDLHFEAHFDLKFEGIDDWYRPIFKDVDSNIRFGDVNKLFTWEEWKAGGMEYYKKDSGGLEYFGTSFNREPNGGRAECWKLNIVG